MRRRAWYALPLLAVVLSCGSDDVGAVGNVDGPVLTSPDASEDGGFDAEVKGVLELDGDCLLLVLEGSRYAVIWPAGTTWQDEPAAAVLPNGEAVEMGGSVYGGGGYLDRDAIATTAGDEVADAADACTGPTGEVAMFNVGSTVEAR